MEETKKPLASPTTSLARPKSSKKILLYCIYHMTFCNLTISDQTTAPSDLLMSKTSFGKQPLRASIFTLFKAVS
jgi:hypothetical protein